MHPIKGSLSVEYLPCSQCIFHLIYKKKAVRGILIKWITFRMKLARLLLPHAKYYLTESEVKSPEKGLEILSRSLRLLLTGLMPNSFQTASIGQCILKAANPRSIIPPILLGLGVEMDHNFGSKWMIKVRIFCWL